jgi:TonB family protein
MIRASIFIALSLFACSFDSGACDVKAISVEAKPALRVAVIEFAGDKGKASATSLAETLTESKRVAVIDRLLLEPALNGVGYDGSINLRTSEARRLGAAIGCDFFVIGKAEVVARSERKNQSHEEAIIAVLLVDGRSGALVFFDFIIEKATSSEAALTGALMKLRAQASGYVERMAEFHAARPLVPARPPLAFERVEEIPAEGSPQAAGFTPPEFLNRVKPDYTDEAGRADISATVEAEAVFQASGEVGSVEVIRWAGFGLDESAVRAIRQLKFKPARRDGKPVSVRAVIQYNFRRVGETNAKPASD